MSNEILNRDAVTKLDDDDFYEYVEKIERNMLLDIQINLNTLDVDSRVKTLIDRAKTLRSDLSKLVEEEDKAILDTALSYGLNRTDATEAFEVFEKVDRKSLDAIFASVDIMDGTIKL